MMKDVNELNCIRNLYHNGEFDFCLWLDGQSAIKLCLQLKLQTVQILQNAVCLGTVNYLCFVLVPTLASSISHSVSARKTVVVLPLTWSSSLELNATALSKCYNYRHLQVRSIILSLQLPKIWLAHICLICSVLVCVWCVRVWIEREREGERERERECVQRMWPCVDV